MDRLSIDSVGTSSRYAVLAANVSKVISASRGRTLNPAEVKLLERASELLDKIVQGSKFIERSEAHALSDPRQDLFAFDHAMSALDKVEANFESQAAFTEIFGLIKGDLHQIAVSNDLEDGRRVAIRNFFDALRELFYRDIVDSSLAIQESDFETVSR